MTSEEFEIGTEESEIETVTEQTKQTREGFMVAQTPIGESELPEGAVPIRTIEDIKNIEENAKGHYILMNDIDFEGCGVRIASRFAGIFDGNYHQLKNLSAPIFHSITDGVVQNLAIIDTKAEKAGIASELWRGTIYNCYVTGKIGKDMESIREYRGGIVAEVMGEDSIISYCYNKADIYSSGDTSGGIVGRIMDNTYESNVFKIEFCENYGTIHGSGGVGLAGICGGIEMDASSNRIDWERGDIVRCTNYGNILEIADQVTGSDLDGLGGILGTGMVVAGRYNDTSIFLNILECANYGQITEYEDTYPDVGGICGNLWMEEIEDASVSVNFSDCLNVSEEFAGMCGRINAYSGKVNFGTCIDLSGSYSPLYRHETENAQISTYSCYYHAEESEIVRSGAQPLSAEQLKNEEFMWENGMNFDGVWWIDETINNGYPHPTTLEDWLN